MLYPQHHTDFQCTWLSIVMFRTWAWKQEARFHRVFCGSLKTWNIIFCSPCAYLTPFVLFCFNPAVVDVALFCKKVLQMASQGKCSRSVRYSLVFTMFRIVPLNSIIYWSSRIMSMTCSPHSWLTFCANLPCGPPSVLLLSLVSEVFVKFPSCSFVL